MPRQRRIGLTGGIATGKSSVGDWLENRGLPVLDADQFAREALAPGSEGAQRVLNRYGDKVRLRASKPEDACIDRAVLGRIVFSDESERRWLEQLVHPMVRRRFEQELASLAEAPVVVLMIPLLFEAGLEAMCNEVWVVHCSLAQQKRRLMTRNHLGAEEAERRIHAQWCLEQKCQRADQVINNMGTPGAWQQQVASLIDIRNL